MREKKCFDLFVLLLPPLPAPLPFPTLPVHPAVSELRPPNDRKLRVFLLGKKGVMKEGTRDMGERLALVHILVVETMLRVETINGSPVSAVLIPLPFPPLGPFSPLPPPTHTTT